MYSEVSIITPFVLQGFVRFDIVWRCKAICLAVKGYRIFIQINGYPIAFGSKLKKKKRWDGVTMIEKGNKANKAVRQSRVFSPKPKV